MTSQQTMVNWAKDNVYKWIDMDGMYGAQCVDLTMAYVKNFADFQIYGNAIDYLTNPIPPGWRRYYKRRRRDCTWRYSYMALGRLG